MLDCGRSNFLPEARSILVECSRHFCRSVSIEDDLLREAIPEYQYLAGYLNDTGILKRSTENQFLFRHESASNFFDYFEAYSYLLFVEALPPEIAKEIASDLTLHLINIWDVSDDPKAFDDLMRSHYYVHGIKLEVMNVAGELGIYLGEILAILCQIAIIQIDPQKKLPEWSGATCRAEIYQ